MPKSKVRSTFTGVDISTPYEGTVGGPNNGAGFPDEITYPGDGDFPVQAPFAPPFDVKPGIGRDVTRSPFENPKIGSRASRD